MKKIKILTALLAVTAMLSSIAFADDDYTNCYGAEDCHSLGGGSYYSVSGNKMTIYGPSSSDKNADDTQKTSTIPDAAFFSYGSMSSTFPIEVTSVEVKGHFTSIGTNAFFNAKTLQNFTFADDSTVTEFGGSVFYNSGLTSFKFPDGTISIGSALAWCQNLTTVTIPDSVTSIGNKAFQNCNHLTNIIIGENSHLTTIGDEAFDWASMLEYINIPDTLTSIGENAFRHVPSTTIIYCNEGSDKHNTKSCEDLLTTTVDGKSTNFSGTIRRYTSDGEKLYSEGRWYNSLSDMNKGKYILKRIYTIDEANAVAKPTGNTVRIKYR